MTSPLISIVICCYNRAHLLPETMASVFAQKYEPVEIVVLDDGSTDNTAELIKSYGDRVRYHWQRNSGVAAARTAACKLARGSYIAFQDDDDLMHPYRISRLYEALCEFPYAALALGDCARIDSQGKLTGHRSSASFHVDEKKTVLVEDGYRAMILQEIDPKPHTTLFRSKYGEQVGWFDTRFIHSAEDTDFFARCGQLGPVVYVPEIVSYYRKGHGSLTENSILSAYGRFQLFEKHLRLLAPEWSHLRRPLQSRLLKAMRKIAFCQSNGLNLPDFVADDYAKRGLGLLGRGALIGYGLSVYINFPVQNLLRRATSMIRKI